MDAARLVIGLQLDGHSKVASVAEAVRTAAILWLPDMVQLFLETGTVASAAV
jgi:hypothetical protein